MEYKEFCIWAKEAAGNKAKNNFLYGAYVQINPDEPFRIKIEKIPVNSVVPNFAITLYDQYPISSDKNVDYFNCASLDSEHKIGRFTFVFYSISEKKCEEFISKKKMEFIEYMNSLIDKMNKTNLEYRTINF